MSGRDKHSKGVCPGVEMTVSNNLVPTGGVGLTQSK